MRAYSGQKKFCEKTTKRRCDKRRPIHAADGLRGGVNALVVRAVSLLILRFPIGFLDNA